MAQDIRYLYEKYSHYLVPGALFAGFLVDTIMLQRVDLFFENLVLISYLVTAMTSIAVINFYERGAGFGGRHIVPIATLAMQFAFGGLFSAFLIFYSRSASLFSSWPFLLILLLLFVGTEYFKDGFVRLWFQVSVLFFSIFSFMIFFVPVVLKSMSAWVFILSGVVSLAIIWLYIEGLDKLIPRVMQEWKQVVFVSVAVVYVFITILYFTNIIPPIPLSLKDSGVYHSIVRAQDGTYIVGAEKYAWYEFNKKQKNEIQYVADAPIYVFSAVFAPTNLNVTIYHRWEYYNEKQGAWLQTDRLAFAINGGRDGGYRGFTQKAKLTPGKWRVSVITGRNQLLGREHFTIVPAKETSVVQEYI